MRQNRVHLMPPMSNFYARICVKATPSSNKYLFQKQTHRHNRQIHKLTILKGGVRKRHQAPYLVHGFRLFDKVLCKGEVGFIFGRRSSGAFDVRRLNGTKISAGISYKKLSLLEKRKMFLTELRKEESRNFYEYRFTKPPSVRKSPSDSCH